VVALGCLAAVPGLALAGSTVHAGDQTLKLTTSLTPNRAGAGSIFGLHVDYESTLANHHVPSDTREIQVQFPDRSHINPGNYAQCQYSAVANIKPSQVAATCPKDSVIGRGKFTADARPTLPDPVPGTVTLYNVKGQHHDVLFVGDTQFGQFAYLFLYTEKRSHRYLTADFTQGSSKSLFTLRTVDVPLGTLHHKPFITDPPKCTKQGWRAALLIGNFAGEPSIRASDTIACRSAGGRRP
jgi:hypothetical protein